MFTETFDAATFFIHIFSKIRVITAENNYYYRLKKKSCLKHDQYPEQ